MKQIIFKSRFIITLGLITIFLAATAFARAGKQDFILHNETGVEIHELYVSPHDSDDWEDDILGKDTLPDGESLKITFDNREKQAKWDLKIVDGKGTSFEWEDLNLTKISEVTLHYKNGRAWADVK